jgi:transglutaminase-like putative cysteine protease
MRAGLFPITSRIVSMRTLRATVILFVLSATPLLAQQEPWDAPPFSSDPKALVAAAEKVPTGDSDVVALLDEAVYTYDASGRGHTAWRSIYRVVGESAIERLGEVSAPWAPWFHTRPAIEARVITKDGSVHLLDKKAVVESPGREESLDIFSDNRIVRAPLPAVAVGSVIEYVISFDDNNPLADAGSGYTFHFGQDVPVQRTRLVIDTPDVLEPRIVNTTTVQPRTETKDGRRLTTFETGRSEAVKDWEINLPFDATNLPYVAFSTGKSWHEIARRYSEIVDKQIADGDVKKLVAAAFGDATDRNEKIARILAAIQKDVRYAGVEVGEASIVPRSPRTVLANKYGDCKDKATLLAAMLREAGIPARVALLRAGWDLDVHADLPGLGRFNHAIVVVEGDAPLWIDPTDEFSRAGELPVQDQGRQALIAGPQTSSLTRTPEAASTANRYTETRTYILPEDGKPRVVEVTEAFGPEEAVQRRWYAGSDRTKLREQMEEYVKSYYNAKSLTKMEAADPHDLGKQFRYTLEANESDSGIVRDGEASVAIHPAALFQNLPSILRNYEEPKPGEEPSKKDKKRQHDFLFPTPSVREWTYRIAPPIGYAARQLPQNETTKLGTMTLTREFSTGSDGVIVAKLRLDTGERRISAAEFEETRVAVGKLLDTKQTVIGFEAAGQTRLAAGDVAGALAEFRKLAELHPKEAQHHIDLSRTLLVGGLGEPARDEARGRVGAEESPRPAHAGPRPGVRRPRAPDPQRLRSRRRCGRLPRGEEARSERSRRPGHAQPAPCLRRRWHPVRPQRAHRRGHRGVPGHDERLRRGGARLRGRAPHGPRSGRPLGRSPQAGRRRRHAAAAARPRAGHDRRRHRRTGSGRARPRAVRAGHAPLLRRLARPDVPLAAPLSASGVDVRDRRAGDEHRRAGAAARGRAAQDQARGGRAARR